ncbi:ABC transporter permease [Clostridium sp.]|uniref:ABC transporter permease n=1 Tax=Clostridium sp. TaxID=1506 RepID=UPI001A512662|nr:ABC transporter permease [Clostridium sp.]MBK5236476.1 ABC transporter permease [Clostridium sp.]
MINKNSLNKINKHNLMISSLIIAVFIIMSILEPRSFLGPANMRGMLIQLPEYGILCFGMMLAMMSGGIDLSLVGIANFASIIGASVMIALGNSPFSMTLGILAALLTGAACGLFNGFLIGYLKIPAMLVTLGGLQLFQGLGLAITKGPAMTGLPSNFEKIANENFIGIPLPFYIFIAVTIITAYILRSTVYGQQLKFMGTNEIASKYSGINNLKVTLTTYMISGMTGAISGILISSHYNSAKSDYGKSYTLLTLLIVVLGGTNPDGGKGNIFGVALAVILLQLISSAFNIMRINSFLKTFVFGLILVFAILITNYLDERKDKVK